MLGGGELDPFEEILVRRRRKAVYAESSPFAFRRGRALLFEGAFLPHYRRKTAFRRMEEAVAELGRFEWLTEDRLASTKRRLLLAEMRSSYSASALAAALGRARWWLGDEREAFDNVTRLEGVTLAQVKAVFKKHIVSTQPVKLYITPRHVPLYVRLFGWLYPLLYR